MKTPTQLFLSLLCFFITEAKFQGEKLHRKCLQTRLFEEPHFLQIDRHYHGYSVRAEYSRHECGHKEENSWSFLPAHKRFGFYFIVNSRTNTSLRLQWDYNEYAWKVDASEPLEEASRFQQWELAYPKNQTKNEFVQIINLGTARALAVHVHGKIYPEPRNEEWNQQWTILNCEDNKVKN